MTFRERHPDMIERIHAQNNSERTNAEACHERYKPYVRFEHHVMTVFLLP